MDNAQECSRADDLVAWLYEEVTAEEAQDFQQHLRSCELCSADAKAFRGIRHSMLSWRNESLGAFALSPDSSLATVPPKRSAIAALKQFLDLSPLWMKGAVGFATVLFCLFAVLAVGRLRQTTPVAVQMGPAYSQQELAKLIEERAQQRLHELQASTNRTQPIVKTAAQQSEYKPSKPRRRVVLEQFAKAPARRPLTREEREQLAADLRLVAEPEDLELELIGDRIARPDE